MQTKFRASVLSLPIGIALMLVPAYSTTITTYSSLGSWQAATSAGYQTVTFTGLAPADSSTNYYSASGVTQDGVEFIGYSSTGASNIQVIDSSVSTYYNDGTGDALIEGVSPSSNGAPLPYIDIVLPANITALGLNLWTASPAAASYSITVAGNTYTVPTLSGNTEVFWGITSGTAISSLQLDVPSSTFNGSNEALADNFSFGASDLTAAPEAGTYLLIGSGLIGFVVLRKRLVARK
jgi:PEP-CTERM motif